MSKVYTVPQSSYTSANSTFAFPSGIMEALVAGELSADAWNNQDDACDCVYQRVGMWKNPYLATTHEIRLCCVWAKLGEQYPQFVRDLPGYLNDNTGEWVTEPWVWNGTDPIPRSIWYRQLASQEGKTLSEIRAEYDEQEPPAGTPSVDCNPVVARLDIVQLTAMQSVTNDAAERTQRMWDAIALQLGLDLDVHYDLDLESGEVRA